MPLGIDVKGRDISVLVEFAVAATNEVFAAVVGDLLPVIIIPTRIFDVAGFAETSFSMGTPTAIR